MPLSAYHQKYAGKSDEEIEKRAEVKEQELASIFRKVSLRNGSNSIRLAVLGCGDRRFIALHKRIFVRVLNRNIEVVTFDITIEHLAGESGVLRHDCTLPLPYTPFDIIYGHVFLKFIETGKQFDVLKNSYAALRPGGMAIHICDKEDYETADSKLPDGLWTVPLDRWEDELTKLGIEYKKIPVKYGLALILLRK